MADIKRISSNLEEPFDFGNNKSYGGQYYLHLEDDCHITLQLHPNQGATPYGKFLFYVDFMVVPVFGERIVGDCSGSFTLDRFLAAGIPVLGRQKLVAVSYDAVVR
ncbi:MAG: hypothetical protein WAW80_01400 [Candidatus Saccharimonadales bacterium]